MTRIQGLPVQLVEIPGLISGAGEDRGGGRALLGVLRGADAIVYCHEASASFGALEEVRAEVDAAGISRPALLAATKVRRSRRRRAIARLRLAAGDLGVVLVSILDDASLVRFPATQSGGSPG